MLKIDPSADWGNFVPDDNIGDELQAAFYWASLSPSERKKVIMGGARTLAEIKRHAPAGQGAMLPSRCVRCTAVS